MINETTKEDKMNNSEKFYTGVIKNFLRGKLVIGCDGPGESELIDMVMDYFDYPHSRVYISDIIHHLALEVDREDYKRKEMAKK